MDERGRRRAKACFYCNESGHIKANCPKKKQDELNRLKCFKCGEIGHFQRNCTQLHSSARIRTQDGCTSGVSNDKPRKETSPVEYSVSSDTQKNTTCASGASAKVTLSDDKAKADSTKLARFPPFIDTHCHLEYVFTRYRHQSTFRAFMIANKYPKNFDGCISTFCDPAAFSSFGVWQDLLMESNIWGAFGIHPHNAKYYYSSGPDLEDKILKCIEHPKCVAYGEIGLDFADHSPSDQQTQREILVRQLQLAISFSKPLLFHCRDADDVLLHIISEYVPREWKIHLHCYTGSEPTAIRFLEKFPNLYFGVCGNVTYRNNNDLRQMVTNLPTQRLVIETDAPYNTPANLSRNCRFSHPAHAFYVAEEIAKLKKADLSEVLITIRENTKKLYSI